MSIPRTSERMPPIHPGEMLREEFMVPLRLSSEKLASALHLSSVEVVVAIVEERQGITGEIALRLSRYFGTTAEFWMNVQKSYELNLARDLVESSILREVQPAPRDEDTGDLLAEPDTASVQPSHA